MTALDDPAALTLSIPITVRAAEPDDMSRLEWYGQYKHYRNLIRRAFREQQRGRRLVLVADFNGFPVAQIVLQFLANNRRIADGHSRGYFYSFRVMEMFRGQGIGTAMMHYGEQILRDRDYRFATIAVATHNDGALRLYQRLGYYRIAEDPGKWSYTDHKGTIRHVHEPCYILEKRFEDR